MQIVGPMHLLSNSHHLLVLQPVSSRYFRLGRSGVCVPQLPMITTFIWDRGVSSSLPPPYFCASLERKLSLTNVTSGGKRMIEGNHFAQDRRVVILQENRLQFTAPTLTAPVNDGLKMKQIMLVSVFSYVAIYQRT